MKSNIREFIEKLIHEMRLNKIEWKASRADCAAFDCEIKGVKINVSSLMGEGGRQVIFHMSRKAKANLSITNSPKGGNLDKMLIELFQLIYEKELDKGLKLIEEVEVEDVKDFKIMSIFEKEKKDEK